MTTTRQPDPERTKPAAHRTGRADEAEPHTAIPEPAPGPVGMSVPGETPHDPGRPVASAPPAPVGVSSVMAKAIAKDTRDATVVRETREAIQARQMKEGDLHGAPRAVGPVVGDEQAVAEALQAIAKVTDPGSLQRLLATVQGRVGKPEHREPKAPGHTA